MSDTISNIKRRNFIYEVVFAATLILGMIAIIATIVVEGGKPGGASISVAIGAMVTSALVCVPGLINAIIAERRGIRNLPTLGNYLAGHRD